jgi:hypothetical protein
VPSFNVGTNSDGAMSQPSSSPFFKLNKIYEKEINLIVTLSFYFF